MSILLPPSPTGSLPGSSFWNDWYEKLRTIINSGSISVLWASLNFAGSSITDIANRAHNSLQAIQGGAAGDYQHLTTAQLASIGPQVHNSTISIQGGISTERYHLTNDEYSKATLLLSMTGSPTATQIVSGRWAVYKDTSLGTVKLWVNDGGTLKSVLLT